MLQVLAHMLAEMEPKKFGDTVADVEGIAKSMPQLNADTLLDTLSDV